MNPRLASVGVERSFGYHIAFICEFKYLDHMIFAVDGHTTPWQLYLKSYGYILLPDHRYID